MPGRDAAPGSDVTASRQAAFAIEALVARILVAGTYLAIGLILVGVALMLASGIDPLAHGAIPPFDLPAIPAEILAGTPADRIHLGRYRSRSWPSPSDASSWPAPASSRPASARLALVSALVVLVVALSIVAAAAGSRPDGHR